MNKKDMINQLKDLFESYRGTDWGMAVEKIGDNVLEIVANFEPAPKAYVTQLYLGPAGPKGLWGVLDEYQERIASYFESRELAVQWAEDNGYDVGRDYQ